MIELLRNDKRFHALVLEVKNLFSTETSGHDYFHIERVCRWALALANEEGADIFFVASAAMVHEVGDYKLNNGRDCQAEMIRPLMQKCFYSENDIERVLTIVAGVSFRGGFGKTEIDKETACVRDADRLDAMGSIGIARAFSYGGKHGRAIYIPGVLPEKFSSAEAYIANHGHTINHFYEKLLLLKDQMITQGGRREAQIRHRFLEDFLEEFYREWNL